MVFTNVHHGRIRNCAKSNLPWWLTICAAALLVVAASRWLLVQIPQPFNYRKEAVAALSEKTEILGVGSSHIYVMLDPELYSRPLMNLSSDAFNYRVVESVLNAHIDRLPSVKLVIIEWDFVPFVWDTMVAYKTNFRRYLEFSPDIASFDVPWSRKARLYWDSWRQETWFLRPFFAEEKLTPGAVVRAIRGARQIADAERSVVKAGYMGFYSVMTENRMGKQRLAVHTRNADMGQVKANFQALRRIVRDLQRRQIKVAFLRFPHHRSYWENQPKEWETLLASYMADLRTEFGESGFELWDLERDPVLPDAVFWDADHLNMQGNARLAPLLEARIEAILSK